MGRASMIMILGASVTIGVMNLQLNRMSEQATENLVRYFDGAVARSLANEAASYVLGQYADSAAWRVLRPARLSSTIFSEAGDHTIFFTLVDTTIEVGGDNQKVIRLKLDAEYGKSTHQIVVYAGSIFGFVPRAFRGALTANGPLDNTVGDMHVDGRDHDWGGNLLSQGGVYGISSGTLFTNRGSAAIGGTDENGNIYEVSSPESPYAVEQNYQWNNMFPGSPDELLEFPSGSLKAIAQNGINGSQYVTNPKYLQYPLRGVTYIELPAGVSWKGAWLGTDPTGILIIHNESGNARIDNVASKTAFKGIIIADYMFHIHLNVLGAIFFLSKNLERVKECSGNQDHKISFSSEAIRRATYLTSEKGTGWRGRVPIVGWRE